MWRDDRYPFKGKYSTLEEPLKTRLIGKPHPSIIRAYA
jgi:hypothetical protein